MENSKEYFDKKPYTKEEKEAIDSFEIAGRKLTDKMKIALDKTGNMFKEKTQAKSLISIDMIAEVCRELQAEYQFSIDEALDFAILVSNGAIGINKQISQYVASRELLNTISGLFGRCRKEEETDKKEDNDGEAGSNTNIN